MINVTKYLSLYLTKIGNVPSILELEKNISFRMINAHQSMSFARPMMPSLAYVGGIIFLLPVFPFIITIMERYYFSLGIHIKPVNPLPADVQVSLKLDEMFSI